MITEIYHIDDRSLQPTRLQITLVFTPTIPNTTKEGGGKGEGGGGGGEPHRESTLQGLTIKHHTQHEQL